MCDESSSKADARRSLRDVGGTSGGMGEFLIGAIMGATGFYLLFNQVQVHTSFWRFGGLANSFGLSLLPLIAGIGFLFWNARSPVGWVLSIGGFVWILAGILMNMDIYFQRTSLFNTILMFVLIAGGLGLVARSLRPHLQR